MSGIGTGTEVLEAISRPYLRRNTSKACVHGPADHNVPYGPTGQIVLYKRAGNRAFLGRNSVCAGRWGHRMASEPKPSTLAAPDGAASISTATVCYQRVAPIQIMLAIVRCFDLYQNALDKHATIVDTPEANAIAAKTKKGAEAPENYLERLKTIEAMLVFLGIYVMSPYVTEVDRAEIDMPYAPSRRRHEAPTRGAITATLHHVLGQTSTSEACRIKTSRIIEAAILYGFAETAEAGRANYKPLQGTERLDMLMTQAGFDAALLLDKAIGNKG